MSKSTEQFIKELQSIFGDKYDYSQVNYINNCTKVTVICPIHGPFKLTPQCLLRGHGCPMCRKEDKQQKALTDFIRKANIIHNNKYDYSKVIYKGSFVPVTIICPIHGTFQQTPRDHLQGNGCQECGKLTFISKVIKYTQESFIAKASKIHNNKYDYSKVNYVDTKTPVCIICPEHGEFWQTPASHFHYGCKKCAYQNAGSYKKDTKESFIEKAKKVHGDIFDYSEVEYINSQTPIKIICPVHGPFMCTPNHHLNGRKCPKCSESQLEHDIRVYLSAKNINFEYQKTFDWLERMSLDFYCPDYKVAIECQGRQHFEPVIVFGGESAFLKQRNADERKHELCINHQIKLYYYSDLKIKYPYDVYTNKEDMINSILKDIKI